MRETVKRFVMEGCDGGIAVHGVERGRDAQGVAKHSDPSARDTLSDKAATRMPGRAGRI